MGGKGNLALIIGGGVGPMAGVLLHEHMIREKHGVQSDRDHVDTWHISAVKNMPDRTSFLLGRESINPGKIMAENVRDIGRILKEKGRSWVVAVPCATFHAPQIYNAFTNTLQEEMGCESIFNLIKVVEIKIKTSHEKEKSVGVLATHGSNASKVWSKPLTDAGISVLEPCYKTQEKVHDAIYNPKYGLKSCFPASSEAMHLLHEACVELYENGAGSVVLGCTELPFVKSYLEQSFMGRLIFHDPLQILAKSLISFFERSAHNKLGK